MRKTFRYLPLILFAALGACGGSGGPVAADSGPAQFGMELIKRETFTLEDPELPVQYLEQLTFLPNGEFVAIDIVANQVRRFDSRGRFLGRVAPPAEVEEDWRPRASGVGSDPEILWVSDKQGRLWRFEKLGTGPATLHSVNSSQSLFVINRHDVVVGRRPTDQGELHLFSGGTLTRSFLESDPSNLSLTARNCPSVAFGGDGNIYAVRFLDPTLVAFNPTGEEIGRWPLLRDDNFREFPIGIDPYTSTRERSLILAWMRTFTTFPRIEWVAGDRIAVMAANDPPQRPNVISFYSPQGELLGAAEVDGYLVGARGRDLYLAGAAYFYDGPCRITRYSIPD